MLFFTLVRSPDLGPLQPCITAFEHLALLDWIIVSWYPLATAVTFLWFIHTQRSVCYQFQPTCPASFKALLIKPSRHAHPRTQAERFEFLQQLAIVSRPCLWTAGIAVVLVLLHNGILSYHTFTHGKAHRWLCRALIEIGVWTTFHLLRYSTRIPTLNQTYTTWAYNASRRWRWSLRVWCLLSLFAIVDCTVTLAITLSGILPSGHGTDIGYYHVLTTLAISTALLLHITMASILSLATLADIRIPIMDPWLAPLLQATHSFISIFIQPCAGMTLLTPNLNPVGKGAGKRATGWTWAFLGPTTMPIDRDLTMKDFAHYGTEHDVVMTGDPVEEHPTQLHRAQWSSWTLAQKPLIVLASQHFGWVTKLLSKFIVLTLLGCAVTRIDEIYRIYRHQFYAHLQQQTATIAFYFAMVALPDLVYRIVIWPAISAVENLFRIDPSEQSQIFGWTLRQDLAGSDYFRYRAFCKRLEEVFVVDHLAAIEILKSGYHLCMVCLLFSKSLQADVMLMLLLLLALKVCDWHARQWVRQSKQCAYSGRVHCMSALTCLYDIRNTKRHVAEAYMIRQLTLRRHERATDAFNAYYELHSAFRKMIKATFCLWAAVCLTKRHQGSLSHAECLIALNLYRQVKSWFIALFRDVCQCLFEPEDTDAKVTRAYLEKSIAEMEHPRPSLHLSSGTVTLRNATFAYNAMTPVLIDVTCTIPGGKITAIVGRTGCGKSTLARLLQRLEVLQSGTIAIDGQDIAKVDPLSVRRNISVITQHTTLFNQSFYVNIGYGRVYTGHLASLAEVKDVAKQCQMYDIINQRPDGFTGSVNNINSRVSGGERQKCLIARAVLKAVPILVLDEATSAMDSKSERALMTLLKSQQHSVTTIIIAHRLPTIIDADNILVMDQGRIVEQGTHETLLQASGLYARMWGYGQDFDPKD